ncbi:MAG: enoyl-CoA hydratase-related protein [Saprospiraceae bacterium]|nr:enoyl-CoA hydratase-related protein [Saprospiraceae bacterium]
MQYQVLEISVRQKVAVITLQRPQALNALNGQTIEELSHFFSDGYRQVGQIGAVVLTGAGEKAFAAGADISEFQEMNKEEGLAFARRGQETFFLIEQFHLPVIAAVNGFALGGGCELAMACHLRIASEQARFGQPEVNLGLIPGYGGTQRLVQYVGKTKAMELMLTGDMLSAGEAQDAGLVNRVVPADALISASLELAARIMRKAPLAVAGVIGSVNAYFTEGYNGFEAEIQYFADLMDSEDFREGTDAFLAKRKPEFKGR